MKIFLLVIPLFNAVKKDRGYFFIFNIYTSVPDCVMF